MAIKSLALMALVIFVAACSQSGPAQQAPPAGQGAPAASAPATAAPAAPAPAAPNAAPSSAAATPGPAPTSRPAEKSPRPRPAREAAPPSRPAPTAQPPAVAAPEFNEVTIPAGTPLRVTLTTALASDTSKVEDQVRATLAEPIVVGGVTAVPAGAELVGTVVDAKESGRVKGRASITFQFGRLIVGNEAHDIRTARVTREAAADTSGDVKKGAIGAGAGALVGAIIGGAKGAAIGAGAGGAGAVLATKGAEVRLPAGTAVRVTLQTALDVLVPREK